MSGIGEPFFAEDTTMGVKNVTAQLGLTTYLHCKVNNLNGKTVSNTDYLKSLLALLECAFHPQAWFELSKQWSRTKKYVLKIQIKVCFDDCNVFSIIAMECLLPRTKSGSSRFCKSQWTGKVSKPAGPWALKHYHSLCVCKIYYTHFIFEVMYHCCSILKRHLQFCCVFWHRLLPCHQFFLYLPVDPSSFFNCWCLFITNFIFFIIWQCSFICFTFLNTNLYPGSLWAKS